MRTKTNIRWSTQTRFITVITAVILVFVDVVLIKSFIAGNSSSFWIVFLLTVIPLVFIASAPLSITLNESHLVLRKIVGTITIDYSQITAIRSYSPNCYDIRIFGSGGFCGFVGVFSSREIGRYFSFVGDPKQAFLIQTKSGRSYVFSCEDVKFVIAIIKKHLP